jgi:hypothetical protein
MILPALNAFLCGFTCVVGVVTYFPYFSTADTEIYRQLPTAINTTAVLPNAYWGYY